ncbi:MAG TPA: transcriptional regulator [Mesorhizobium sp.]|jgi:hypothetical protein|nr:transcriptional regulator [Mesorhizobium sp.]
MTRQPSEAEQTKRETAALATQYRAIGPAALVAALLCAAKKDDNAKSEKKAA